MRNSASLPVFGLASVKLLTSVALAVMLAGCSSAVTRFEDTASSNPSDADPVYTASVPRHKQAAVKAPSYSYQAPSETISSKPLASAPLKQPSYNTAYNYEDAYKAPTYKAPTYKAPSAAAPAAPSYKAPTYTAQKPAAVKPRFNAQGYDEPADMAQAEPVSAPAAQPVASAGTVKVASGMTLYSIARANGLTVGELASANNINPPYTVSSGQVLRIPGKTMAKAPVSAARPTSLAEEEVAPVSVKGSHTVAAGETLFSLGRKYGVSPYAIADANGLPHNTSLSVGQRIRLPSGSSAPVVAAAPKKIIDPAPISDDGEAAVGESASAQTVPPPPAAVSKPQPVPQQQASVEQGAPVGVGTMRWPVKGKVISGFGPKSNGLKNEGINIAVPEGTGVRAAEGGVVAYAGNELKGYGNLVLIRHDGGWVTAYAHASELFVKRGDVVKRGPDRFGVQPAASLRGAQGCRRHGSDEVPRFGHRHELTCWSEVTASGAWRNARPFFL